MCGKDVAQTIGIAFNIVAGHRSTGWPAVVKRLWATGIACRSTAKRDTHEVATAFDALRGDIANWAHNVASYFDESRANIARWAEDVQRDADNVVKWFQALPGRILRALGNMGTLLVSAGRDLAEGFIRGIESMFGAVASAAWGMVKSVGSTVLHALGIGSPSKVAHWWGQMIAQGMADGIAEHARLPAAAAARMAAGVSAGLGAGGHAAAAGAGGNGTLTVQLELAGGDSQFMTALAGAIRARGGDPRILTKKVKFQ